MFYRRCAVSCEPTLVQAGDIVVEDGSESTELIFIAMGQLEVQRKVAPERLVFWGGWARVLGVGWGGIMELRHFDWYADGIP